MGLLSKIFSAAPTNQITRFVMPIQASPLRGWTNLGLYEIHGLNPNTGRSNKKMHECISESEARLWAKANGLTEPIQVKEVQNRRASDEQIKVCQKMGIKANFQELSIVDANALIWYVDDGDKRKINSAEWAAACAAGYPVSALCGPTHYKYIMKHGDWRYRDE